ncbi:MAG: hypothetical protein WD042_18740 [Phycisphaeraceae bacterium]
MTLGQITVVALLVVAVFVAISVYAAWRSRPAAPESFITDAPTSSSPSIGVPTGP